MKGLFAKKSIENLQTYKPNFGKSKLDDLIRLSANEGALGTSSHAIDALKSFYSDLPYHAP